MMHGFSGVLLLSCLAAGARNARAEDSGGQTSPDHAKRTLRMATLAPRHSPWGKVFTAWSKAVEKKTAGDIAVQWIWNGAAGPENGVVGKIRSGQLSGAVVTAFGLSAIHKPIVLLQMPGAFKTWGELDRARDGLKGEFDEAVKAQGFYVAGWGDVGIGRWMSRGFDVVTPGDLKGKSPGLFAQDIISPKVIEAIGGVTGRSTEVVDLLPLLSSRAVNVIASGPLAAEQLQWASQLDHMNDGVVAFGIGAAVISEQELQRLSGDSRAVVEQTYRAASDALTKDIRKEDDAAFGRLTKKMIVHHQTDAERAEWDKVFKKACQRTKAAFPGVVLAKIGYC